MLYYLSLKLTPDFGVFNVLSYHTVRSGGALITAFLLSLLVGPAIIEGLRRLKVGQFIKEEHVQDLHALHKSKAGTPTMGGVLIILTTVLSLLLWSTLTNRLLIMAVLVLCAMGAVGFIDDFIKLRRKHNDGLSAKTKLIGQIVIGSILGASVVLNPITFGASYLSSPDILDWEDFLSDIDGSFVEHDAPLTLFGSQLSDTLRSELASSNGVEPRRIVQDSLFRELKGIMSRRDVVRYASYDVLASDVEGGPLLKRGADGWSEREVVRMNRLLLELTAPEVIAASPRNVHTKVSVPGLKDTYLPFGGMLYIAFIVLIIVSTSNGVNLTDGLDGLAIGASVVSISAFTAIAYVVSRADWSSYLFVMHIPEASELTVFGAALLGAGLGFLWFNAHPAEIFMGDTGSLALGGVMGAMAVLTKQELLLPIVGGLFVLETLSVIIQVVSFKLTGNRVFRMAPLHHHFELKGWSESKVTIRFWILALVFALMSLATLKLR